MKNEFYHNMFTQYRQADKETQRKGLEYWRAILHDAAKTEYEELTVHAARMIATIMDAANN